MSTKLEDIEAKTLNVLQERFVKVFLHFCCNELKILSYTYEYTDPDSFLYFMKRLSILEYMKIYVYNHKSLREGSLSFLYSVNVVNVVKRVNLYLYSRKNSRSGERPIIADL